LVVDCGEVANPLDRKMIGDYLFDDHRLLSGDLRPDTGAVSGGDSN
jgi:hypothetical protein